MHVHSKFVVNLFEVFYHFSLATVNVVNINTMMLSNAWCATYNRHIGECWYLQGTWFLPNNHNNFEETLEFEATMLKGFGKYPPLYRFMVDSSQLNLIRLIQGFRCYIRDRSNSKRHFRGINMFPTFLLSIHIVVINIWPL